MRNLILFLGCIFALNINADNKIPSKSEFDTIMFNAVKQMNKQMSGTKIDEFTNLKFVTYDLNPPLFSYFYTSTVFDLTKQSSLNSEQVDAMKKFHITKTCSSQFKPLMKPYNFRVAHIFEDKPTGKVIYKLTVSHNDC